MKTTMKPLCVVVIASLVLCAAGNAQADWDVGDPAKWVQMPDLNAATSLDVYAMHPTVLADDFECTSTEPITSIHIWGSWKGDYFPAVQMEGSAYLPPDHSEGQGGGAVGIQTDPAFVNIRLAIHADIPADQSGLGYSIPGEMLWEDHFYPDAGNVTARKYGDALQGWYNPNTDEWLADDHDEIWQYNCYIGADNPFEQTGTSAEPVVYWLVVDAVTASLSGDPEFGWKTSLDHWNDDAVWAESSLHDASGDQWQELYHPSSAFNMSLDMAFVVVPEPVTFAMLLLAGGLAVLKRKG